MNEPARQLSVPKLARAWALGGLGRKGLIHNAHTRLLLMLSFRHLLATNPFLPAETRALLRRRPAESRQELVRLGVTECEAAELLDERPCSNDRKATSAVRRVLAFGAGSGSP